MKYALVSVMALALSMSLAGCNNDSSAEQTAEQKKATQELKTQFESAKQSAEKALAAAKEKTDESSKKAMDGLQNAVDKADASLKELQTSAGEKWNEKKPVMEAALRDVGDKAVDVATKLKTKLDGVTLPSFGPDATTQPTEEKK